MQVFSGLHNEPGLPMGGSVVTIGNFDGVHFGHQEIVRLAVRQARERDLPAVAITFNPHPQAFFFPERPLSLLTTSEEKVALLGSLGLDFVDEEPFTAELAAMAPSRFFSEFLLGRLNARAIVVGYDFAFGKGRQGHLEILQGLCDQAGVRLTVVQQCRKNGDAISSSRIRALLQAGDLPGAHDLLGRHFSYQGEVVRGAGRGGKLGFPTANLRCAPKLVLPYGVYATWVSILGSAGEVDLAAKRMPGVTNLGVRPTFERQDAGAPVTPLVETHLLGARQDLYGRQLRIDFVKRLRDERKFAGIEELKAQIARDAVEAAVLLPGT